MRKGNYNFLQNCDVMELQREDLEQGFNIKLIQNFFVM